ncbi:MAG: hypothetical protein PHH59_12620 [Methylovulum sp.]|uniref:hypothetical protein n=1 Tax=Methylovulum sp. TaxID=1916980 RepID=UPI0026189BB6|nr:hypothetical protein [Methylovulum sp.]MDD2724852.1 hypothetical protein [Methylovulum sp.]MDD5125730.1 hypothetical protein [Methylovulum sp.]
MAVHELDVLKDIPANVLTSNIMNAFAEAAVVCLDNQGHKSGVELEIIGHLNSHIILSWSDEITPQIKDAWHDLQETTEYGATYLAILIIYRLTPFKVIERSLKRTGFDYWLGEKEDEAYPFQKKARLEISGILQENKGNTIARRADIKLTQTKQSDDLDLPAYIVIVEFSKPRSWVEKK